MPPVIGRQENAVELVIGGDDYAAAIEHAVFAQIFFINAQHVGRGSRVSLHVVVELKAVAITEVARLVHA